MIAPTISVAIEHGAVDLLDVRREIMRVCLHHATHRVIGDRQSLASLGTFSAEDQLEIIPLDAIEPGKEIVVVAQVGEDYGPLIESPPGCDEDLSTFLDAP